MSQSRRLWLGGAAAAGLLAGAGVAWRRFQPDAIDAAADEGLGALWALQLDTPEGKKLALQSLRGKPLVVNFWATWCPPCIEELPLLNAFYQQHAANGWQILGLAVDQTTAVQKFLQQRPLDFPVVMAATEGVALSRSLGNGPGGLPFTLVVDASGKVRDRKLGRVGPDDLQRWLGLK